MIDLIQELEQAQEGSRELDAQIWLLTTPGATRKKSGYYHKKSGKWCEIDEMRVGSGRLVIVPHYTTNLQDALGLVPEGWIVNGLKQLRDFGWDCTLWATGPARRVDCGMDEKGNNRPLPHTPALALTIAALKALQEET